MTEVKGEASEVTAMMVEARAYRELVSETHALDQEWCKFKAIALRAPI